MTTLADVVDLLHQWYPPATAEGWDAVGLVHGDPSASVKKVMFAVDPTEEVAREAADWGADLLVVHHPLFLKPVHGFPATTAKGRTLATLVRAGCALLTAHTNADQATSGVSESLALALGLSDLEPIIATPRPPMDKIVVYVPHDAAAPVRAAIGDAGAGAIGNYDHCSFQSAGEGRFRPLEGAEPTIGTVGDVAVVDEHRIEAVLPRRLRSQVVAAMLANHPYEQPAYDITELADPGTIRVGDSGIGSGLSGDQDGTGRIGLVEPTTLREFAQVVAETLPGTETGVRVAGDPERVVRRVAVCGGAGDFLLDQLADSDVDVYLTSDVRHHPAAEFIEKGGPALIDVAHWAAESTWLPVVAARLTEALGDTVDSRVSEIRTDPWTFRA